MAGDTRPRAHGPGTASVEVLGVGTHLEGTRHPVALHTVRLLVTRSTTLQTLAGRLAVAQQEEGLRVVESGPEAALAFETDFLVARSAERRRAVARRTLVRTSVRIGGMPRHETRWMVAPVRRPVVTVDAIRLGMARRACTRLGSREVGVRAHEEEGLVRLGLTRSELNSRSNDVRRGRQIRYVRRDGADMARGEHSVRDDSKG